jgi:TfoX/Sxy family transcriptional regulator of competence genes
MSTTPPQQAGWDAGTMQIPRPSPDDKEFFLSLLPDSPDVEVKPMFGNLGAFVNGNMFAGLFGPQVGVKLADSDRDELAEVEGTAAYGPAERPMSGYLSLPPAWRDQPRTAAAWVDKALAHVRTLPAKKKPAKKK